MKIVTGEDNVLTTQVVAKELPNMNSELHVHLLGDVHYDSPTCNKTAFKRVLKDIRAQHDAGIPYMIFLMGDHLDRCSSSERAKIARSALHESTQMNNDRHALSDITEFMDLIWFARDNIAGVIQGNHYWRFLTGDLAGKSSDAYLAAKLGCPWLGFLSYVNLGITFKSTTKGTAVDLVLCHGKGGGKMVGTSINQVDDLRRIFPGASVYCVSSDTEIMTARGWMGESQLLDTDQVGTVDPATGLFKWSPVLGRVGFDYEGPAVQLKNRCTDMVLHPKHRAMYQPAIWPASGRDGWRFTEAENLLSETKQILVPLAGTRDGDDPGLNVSDCEAALCGWIASEGSFGERGGVKIYQKPGDKCDTIRDLLVESGWKFTEHIAANGMCVFYVWKQDRARIEQLLDGGKNVPDWLFKCSDAKFNLFLDALMLGDGHWNDAESKTSGTFYQADENFIDRLQMACAAHGYRTAKNWKTGGFSNRALPLVSLCSAVDLNITPYKKQITTIPYEGRMWCVTTEQGTFIARRNGKVFVTGNCQGHNHQSGAVPAAALFAHRFPGTAKPGLDLRERKQLLVRTGSFLKGYEQDTPSYVVQALYKPNALGHAELILKPTTAGGYLNTDIKAVV